ncbi:MAG: phosphotransferase [Candidatus Paceibacterota bacterium]|jgi:homoserine kinase type II
MLIKQKMPIAIIKNLLKDFDLEQIKKIKPLATSGNISYIIETDLKKYFFRLSPLGIRWRSKEEIFSELELLNYLIKNSFPVKTAIYNKKGEQIISWNGHFGYIREFIEAKEKLNPTIKEVEKFGELLGRFHKLTENYKTNYKRKHRWDLEESKKNFKEDKKLILKGSFLEKKKFVDNFQKEISLINFPSNLPKGMIHEDLGKRHVLWKGEKIVCIVDFDRSYYGDLILDLGQACRGWCFVNNWKKWNNKNFEALINGYQKHRKLNQVEKQYLINAIKFAILERSISFCLRYVLVTKDKEDLKYSQFSLSQDGLLGMIKKISC